MDVAQGDDLVGGQVQQFGHKEHVGPLTPQYLWVDGPLDTLLGQHRIVAKLPDLNHLKLIPLPEGGKALHGAHLLRVEHAGVAHVTHLSCQEGLVVYPNFLQTNNVA